MYFSDKTETPEKLTAERRKEISLRENGIYGKSTYSNFTRKENALKIFTDDQQSMPSPTVSDELDWERRNDEMVSLL